MMRMSNPRRFFLVFYLVLFACFTASSGQSFPGEKRPDELGQIKGRFAFAVIGDTRLGDAADAKLAKMLMEGKPAFVTNLGDVVRRPGSLPDWKPFGELSSPIAAPYF